MDTRAYILVLILFSSVSASAQSSLDPILAMIEAHVGLVLLIASIVIILLMILMLLFLQNISEHLNWIRRIR